MADILGPVKDGEELQAILDALYDCTTVDLQLQEAPLPSAAPTQAKGEANRSVHIPSLKEASLPQPDEAAEQHRGPVLHGEHVSLLLYLRPKRDKLEECIGHSFGLYGSEQKQLDCWNNLTSIVHAEIQLLPSDHPSVDRIIGESIKSETAGRRKDVSVIRGKEDYGWVDGDFSRDSGTSGMCHTLQTARPVQVAALSSKSGECRPSVYKLEFVVKDCNIDEKANSARDFIHVKVELRDLASLKKVIAEATEGVTSRARTRENTDVSLALGNLCCHPTDEDTAVLRDLSNISAYTERAWMNAPSLLIVLRQTTVLEPLKVDVTTTEPYPGMNCVQVTVCNPLTLKVTITDLCIHLPTTIPLGLESQLGKGPDSEILCILNSIPSVAHTAITSPCGFDATMKIECSLVSVGKEVCTVVTHCLTLPYSPFPLCCSKVRRMGLCSPSGRTTSPQSLRTLQVRQGVHAVVGNGSTRLSHQSWCTARHSGRRTRCKPQSSR